MQPLEHRRGERRLVVDERTLALPAPLCDAWAHEDAIVLMVGGSVREISIFDRATLSLRHRIAAPAGFELDRLTRHLGDLPAAIAWTAEPIHGHSDWQFVIDLAAGTLTRTHPSR